MPETITAVDISKALAIEGYMQPPELEWLAQEATKHTRIAEVGSYYGRSTRALCDHALDEVHAYDDFFGPRDTVLSYNKRMGIFEAFKNNLREHIDSGLLVIHDQDYRELKPQGLFDLIFIDGGHTYADVKRDLEKWIPHLAPGGTISGHDYDIAYPGILRVLAEAFEEGSVQIVPDTTIWYAVKDDNN